MAVRGSSSVETVGSPASPEGPDARTPRPWFEGWSWLLVIGLLIIYGSLYPFHFRAPEPDALARLFADWTLTSSRGDMLGNLALFVPWGMVGTWLAVPREGALRVAAMLAVSGFVLALSCQVAQLWIPARDAALADVFWNMVGTAVGQGVGAFAAGSARGGKLSNGRVSMPALLLGAWLLAYWLPLVPSIDLQLVKNNLKAALDVSTISLGMLAPAVAMALALGYLLARLVGDRMSGVLLPMLLLLAMLGKLLVHGAKLDVSEAIGFLCGTAVWWGVLRLRSEWRPAGLLIVLVAAYTVGGLAPFEFRAEAVAFNWSPLSALLTGSMLANAQALAGSMVLFATLLFLVHEAGGSPAVASVGVAVWVLCIELAQTWIATRTADITQPIVVLLLGQMYRTMRLGRPRAAARTRPDVAGRRSERATSTSLWRPVAVALGIVVVSVLALSALLRIPGIPYNVRELFIADGSPPYLAVFALALIWAGLGSAWLGAVVADKRAPAWILPPMAFLVSLVSLALLWGSVTDESIGDITGSSNLYWFVTQRGTWGAAWQWVFLTLLPPEVVGFIERCVRFAALYAPLPIFLGLMTAAIAWPRRGGKSTRHWIGVLTGALLTLWLCKAVAFDWSSTDNLNELIARDGEWGWGGGGFLYLLLALICATSAMWVRGGAMAMPGLVWRAGLVVAAVPLGWWLLNNGLDPAVEKYGNVFSGAQFLLGPDRKQMLSTEILFFRWALVQIFVTATLAVGARLGLAIAGSWLATRPARGISTAAG